MSNYLLKTLERLVSWKMDEALIKHPIHPKQHGFQSGRSTESALSNTVNYIESFLFQNHYALGVFLDISSAFDSICPDHVRDSLVKHGGDPDLIRWYYGYLKHRDLQFSQDGATTERTTNIGFSQGGVCSAKFWLIAFDEAIKIINTLDIEGNGYADDCSHWWPQVRLPGEAHAKNANQTGRMG